ncbi:Guanine nucleotide-binding protein, beta subunit [Parasponia andersonii]|uniref:Guanine nucleotide-binding protein, beta subunit n=1 Tax=Parasponia andersonii TaxID=3476 RepID=A0A2P5DVK8_PARAD|nr:Guanine nucleotide-binding protein, beta subunit [Parasponia andersonii]
MGSGGGEALVVCSNKSSATGISIWDIATGNHLLHIPTCASPPRGLVCLRNQFIFASQIHRHGSVGGGAIFMWHLNKPQPPLRSYPLEAIGPLSCTKDGVYLSGGALSGNAYIWEAGSGKLLKTWRAHHRSLTYLLFSDDGSLLISGSDDDVEDSGSSTSLLHFSLEHSSAISGLSTTSGSSSSILVSSSTDGSCKVSDLVLRRVISTVVYPLAITAVVLHPAEQILFCGSVDGRIFINNLDFDDQVVDLQGHNGAVTALTFCQSGLVSASEDCTICIWDATSWTVTQKFNHQKGAVTNLAVIPRSSLISVANNRKVSNAFRVSSLDKYPQPPNLSKEAITLIPSSSSLKESQSSVHFQKSDSCQQILNLQSQKEWTPAAMQMKVETSIENRIWAMKMAKHVTEMNRHLQSRLLDLMETRFLWSRETDSATTKRRKKPSVENRCDNNGPPSMG